MNSITQNTVLFKLGKFQIISTPFNLLGIIVLIIYAGSVGNWSVGVLVVVGFYLALLLSQLGVLVLASIMKVEVTGLELGITGWKTITKKSVLPYTQRDAMLLAMMFTLFLLALFSLAMYTMYSRGLLPRENEWLRALKPLTYVLLTFATYCILPSFISPGGEIINNVLFQRLRNTRMIMGIMFLFSLCSMLILGLIYLQAWEPSFGTARAFFPLVIAVAIMMIYYPLLMNSSRLEMRAQLFLKEKNYLRAIEDYTTIVNMNLDRSYAGLRTRVLINRGWSYLFINEVNLGVADLKQVDSNAAYSAAAQLIRVWLELSEETRPTREQIAWLYKISNLTPHYHPTRLARIIFDWLNHQQTKLSPQILIDELKVLIKDYPEDPDTYYWLGVIYHTNNQPAEAEAMYAKAVELDLPSPFNKRFRWVDLEAKQTAEAGEKPDLTIDISEDPLHLPADVSLPSHQFTNVNSLSEEILFFKLGNIRFVFDFVNLIYTLLLAMMCVLLNGWVAGILIIIGFYLALFLAELGGLLSAKHMKLKVEKLKFGTTGWKTTTSPILFNKERNYTLLAMLLSLFFVTAFCWIIFEVGNERWFPACSEWRRTLFMLKGLLLAYALYCTLPSFISTGGEILINILFQRIRDTRIVIGIMILASSISGLILVLLFFVVWRPDFSYQITSRSIIIGLAVILVGLMFSYPLLVRPILLALRGANFMVEKNYRRAIEDLSTFLKMKLNKEYDNIKISAHINRGLAYLKVGNSEMALADLKPYIMSYPASPNLQLLYLWVELSEEVRPSQEQLTRLRNIANLAPSYATTLARIIFDWLTPEQAKIPTEDLITQLKSLIIEKQEEPDAYYWLGVLYEANNQPAEAEALYYKAVEVGLPPPFNKRFGWFNQITNPPADVNQEINLTTDISSETKPDNDISSKDNSSDN